MKLKCSENFFFYTEDKRFVIQWNYRFFIIFHYVTCLVIYQQMQHERELDDHIFDRTN